MRFLVLFFRLFELHLVDFDTVFGMVEVSVDGECIRVVDVSSLGMFGERP